MQEGSETEHQGRRANAEGARWRTTLLQLWRRLDLNLALIVLLSVFSFAPLTYPGFFQSHSSFLPVFNLFDLERDLWHNWGWVPTLGTGVDLLAGEGPLPYVLAESFRWAGLGGVEAIKAVYLLGFVASGWTSYLLGKELYGARGGIVAASVYVYVPYHLATVYVRGAFAEAWAFVLYPLVLLCWDKYIGRGTWSWAAASVVLYAVLGLTSAGLALLFALVVFAYILVLAPTRRVKGQAVLLLATGLAFSLLLFMPSVVRYGLLAPAREDFSQHFVYPVQLLSGSWGYGVSTSDWSDTLPLQLGLAATGLTLVAGMLLAGWEEGGVAVRRRAGLFVGAAIVLALSLLHPASFLWQVTGAALLLHYPWQLLAFAGLAMSLASGAVVGLVGRLARFRWQVVLITLVILASYEYLSPRFTDVRVAGAPVAILEDRAALLSYRREGLLLHGATVRLTLYWQSLRSMETDYTVFVHIVDQEGVIWGQRDAVPQGGERPTSSWELGEIVEDQYEIQIDVEGPSNAYAVELGMYDPGTGERLADSQGNTVVILE